MNYLPHRHSLKSVLRFVPVLETLISNHKTIGEYNVQFDPSILHLSVETAIARLRDAVYSLSSKLVSDKRINPEELAAIWPRYRVVSDGSNVLITPRATEQGQTLPPDFILSSGGVGRTSLAVLQADLPGFVETLTAFAVLLGQRLLQGEVIIEGDLPSTLQLHLEANYDIVISQTGAQQHTMI